MSAAQRGAEERTPNSKLHRTKADLFQEWVAGVYIATEVGNLRS